MSRAEWISFLLWTINDHLRSLFQSLQFIITFGLGKLAASIRKTKVWSIARNRSIKLLQNSLARKIISSVGYEILAGW